MKKRYYEEIYDYLKDIVIIDTHEHIPVAEKYRDQQTDLLKEYMTYYFCSDLVSAGYQNMDYLTGNAGAIAVALKLYKVTGRTEYCEIATETEKDLWKFHQKNCQQIK